MLAQNRHFNCLMSHPMKVTDRRRDPGYTLVELVIVIFAISILTVLSYFKLQPALEHGKVNAAASVLAADLQFAQVVAARQRKPVVVILTTATKSYVIRDRADATQVFRTRYLGASTDYSLDEFTGSPSNTVQIFSTGASTTATTFTLGIHGYHKTVKFTRAGQVRVLSA